MKKQLLFYIILIPFLASIGLAAIESSDITHAYECENDLSDETGNWTLVNIGSVGFSSGEKKLGSYSCDLRDDVNDYLVTNFVEYNQAHAISMWFYSEGWSASDYQFLYSTNDTNAGGAAEDYSLFYTTEDSGMARYTQSGILVAGGNIPPFNSWQHVVGTYDGDSFYYYLNGTLINSSSKDPASNKPLIFGRWSTDLARAFDGYYDEIMIFDRNLTAAEALDLWNGGSGKTYADYNPSETINVSNTYPANNSIWNNTILNFNATVNSTGNFDCSLYINSTINDTNSYSSGTNVLANFNVTFPVADEATYSYYMFCNNTNGDNQTTTTTYFIMDSVFPRITWTLPTNTTVYNLANGSNLTASILIEDPNLYSYYYNLSLLNGSVLYSFNNTNLTGQTSYTVNNTADLTSYSGMDLLATLRICDGHTDNNINFDARKSGDNLYFDNNKIKIYPENKFSTIDSYYTRQQDRYQFTFRTFAAETSQIFYVESADYIDIIRNSRYKGHLITGERWIDFEIPNIDNVRVDRITDKKVKIIVTLKGKTSYWTFNSVGELNCLTETTRFGVINNYVNITYSNYQNYSGDHWARNLSYSLNYECAEPAGQLLLYIDNVFNRSLTTTCDNTTNAYSSSYQHSAEGNYTISFVLNSTYNFKNDTYNNWTFTSDLTNPTAHVNITAPNGFVSPLGNITINCTDTMFNNLSYNLTFNTNALFFAYAANNTPNTNTTTLLNGLNNATALCGDLFGYNSSNQSLNTYIQTLYLIDEKNNSLFDVSNISGARVYFDDNSSLFDFKTNGNVSQVNYTATNNDKLRFELSYSNGDIITRYVDVSLAEGELRVCANKEGITHYEQLILSAIIKPVTLKNVYSNCVIAQDYTRFAYQDSYILKAYTIASNYYLYTYDSGNKVYLASMDGSISTYYNLDVLEFNQEGYNLDIIGDALTFERSAGVVTIRYRNLQNGSVSTTLTIRNMNTTTDVFTMTETDTPNDILLYFDTTTLANITNTTLFRVRVETTDSEGVVEVLNRYFNLDGSSGIIPSGLAFGIAVLLTIFGLTFTAARVTLGWFGIVIMLGSIFTLSFAVITWYVTLLMAFNIIILVYIIILMVNQNYSTAAGIN